jgi:glycosyltransferase involved in cell wall biosynthesis
MFTGEFWQDMALLQTGHDFIFITSKKMTPKQPVKNVHTQRLKKTHFQWIDQKRLGKMLTEWQADRLITIQETGFSISNHFIKKNDKKPAAQPGRQVLFATGKSAQQPAQNTSLQAVTVIPPALREAITSLSWAETESIKTQYTGGRSFFLFTGDISEHHRLIELLKAFSLFKKWQLSNMQLVIAGSATKWTDVFEEKLSSYKYKQDVVLLKNISNTEMPKLAAACYALVYPVAENVFPLALLRAVQSNKAIIATDNQMNRQITGAAAWVDNNNTAEGFAKEMILLYKDENQQQLLVQQTKEEAKQFNRQQMLATAWQCIEQ